MSEQDKRIPEENVPETVEYKPEAEKEKRAAEKKAPKKAVNKKSAAKRRKHRRKNGMPVQVVALLLVITLLFGVVVGYAMGRRAGSLRVKDAEGRIDELQNLLMDENSVEFDVFTDELSEENEAALGDLSGESFEAEEVDTVVTALQGEDGFDVEEEEKTAAESVVVAEFKGGKLMNDEVQAAYEQQALDYVFSGYSEEDIADELIQEVMTDLVMEKVLAQHAQELGVYDLSAEDYQQIEAEAKKSYDEQVEFYKLLVEDEGMTDAALTQAAKDMLLETEGVDSDTVQADLEAGWWTQKLYDSVTADVAVDPDAIQQVYQERLDMQKEDYQTYADDYESDQMNGETILYNLPGYRAVQLLLLDFENPDTTDIVMQLTEEMAAMDPEKNADAAAEIEAQIDECYAPAEEQAQKILDELNAGADFEALIEKYGDDDGMKDPAVRAEGYYVSANSIMWQQEMIDSAMALEKAGDVSGIIRLDEGVCILKYASDVPEGVVALDDVYDSISAEALEEAKYAAYEKQVEQWMKDAEPAYYPERML